MLDRFDYYQHASFGRLLAQLRHERGLTQRALAKRLGMSPRTLEAWEAGYKEPRSPWKGMVLAKVKSLRARKETPL